MTVPPPHSPTELFDRARALGGRTFIDVAEELQVELPRDPRRAKGFVGQLLEQALGARGGSAPEPDFPHLGIELKTLPVDDRGRVRESTFVCTAPLAEAEDARWEASRVRHKLAKVLFVIVEADPRRAHARRRFGAAFAFALRDPHEAELRADWEELTGRIGAGEVEAVDARIGQHLQLRPKGADSSARALAYDADGAPMHAPARGFYLRARFTQGLLVEHGLAAP